MFRPMPFVVGVPRSGTTLLRMMLDAHPALAVPPETGFLPALASLDRSRDAAADAWRTITTSHTWPDFHLDAGALRAALAQAAPVSPADATRLFYGLYARRFGKARWGDKTPTYGGELMRIAAMLPESRFVHLIRDGRDVVVSVRDTWFRPGDSVEACAADWAARLERTRAQGGRVAHYLEVRYEALVSEPEMTLRQICAFVDLPFDPRMLAYHARAAARLAEHQPRYGEDGRLLVTQAERIENQRLVMAPPRPDRIGRWKRQMTPGEVARVEAVAGAWLDRLGYGVRREAVW